MKDRIYNITIKIIFFFTAFFLTIPLILLIIKGVEYIPFLIVNNEVIFSILLSFKSTIITTLICLALAIPTSVYLNGLPLRTRKPLKNLLFLPLTLPHLVSGIALLLLFGNIGIGEFLEKYLNLSFIYTQKGIVLAQCFVNLPLTIKVILMALDEINDKMIFVARTLGCNQYQSFKYVVFPSLKKGIVSGAIMTWSKALGEFGAVIMVAGTTRMKTEILPTAIFLNMSTGDLDVAIGISVILIFLSIKSLTGFENITNKNKEHKK